MTRVPDGGRARAGTEEKPGISRPFLPLVSGNLAVIVNEAALPNPNSDAGRRRATVGEGRAPLQPGFWGLSPSKNPNSKIYSAESGKSINQIFDNLKTVFDGIDADVKVSKKKSGGVKVVASKKDSSGRKSKIKVSVQEKEPGKSVLTMEAVGGAKGTEILQEIEKKLDI